MRRNIDESKRSTAGTRWALCLLVLCGAIGLASQASGQGILGSYLELKGGIYSPSAAFDLGNVNVETIFKGNTRTGVNGELAIGHFFLPTLGLEAGIGYFKGKGSLVSATGDRHDANFDVVPALLTAKALIPMGPVNPYGELGIGAYFTKFKVSDNLNTFSGNTTFGLHAGAGLNVNITQRAFLGVEGRYVWANPKFGDQKIKLNDTEYALNGFKLNGFTTTLGLGFSF